MNTKTCPICMSGNLEERSFSSRLINKGIEVNITSFLHSVCNVCEAEVADDKQLKHNKLLAIEFQRATDGYLTPSEITRIRKKLKLNIRDASELIGGGGIAFSKYENGITKQSNAVDNLIRLLDAHPELIGELREYALQRKVAENVQATLFFQPGSEVDQHPEKCAVSTWYTASSFIASMFKPIAERPQEDKISSATPHWMAFT